MRFALVALLAAPAAGFAQAPDDAKTAAFVAALYDPATGGYRVKAGGPPSLRACNGAVKALKAMGRQPADAAKTAAFVKACYDPAAGAFAEPGQKPDVAVNAVGVMIAVELGVPKAEFQGAVDTLGKTAKSFEEVRMAAAAVEAWGPADCPFDLAPWDAVIVGGVKKAAGASTDPAELARMTGSAAAYFARLGRPVPDRADMVKILTTGQKPDGGYGAPGAAGSDLETTYRVMRALYLLKAEPAAPEKLAGFLAACRTVDGGVAVKPGEPGTMSGVYYAAVIGKWLKK